MVGVASSLDKNVKFYEGGKNRKRRRRGRRRGREEKEKRKVKGTRIKVLEKRRMKGAEKIEQERKR